MVYDDDNEFDFEFIVKCPFCGAEVTNDEQLYVREGEVVGCKFCIVTMSVREFEEKLAELNGMINYSREDYEADIADMMHGMEDFEE